MSINFPSSLDNFINPTPTTPLAPVHAGLHADNNDAIEALEARVGINSSTVITSHDYKLGEVTGVDKAVGKTATQTLSNKTFTAPQINMGSDATGDTYYRNAGGITTRLPAGSSGQIIQTSAAGIPEWIANPAASDASTTVKGVSEEATQAETDAGTATGGTGARLFVNPPTVRARLLNSGVVDTGSSTAYAIAPSPAITAYATYQEFTFKAINSNSTTTPSVNVNGVGAKTIVSTSGGALQVGQIPANAIVTVVYDGTNMQLVTVTSGGKYYAVQSTRASGSGSGTQTLAHGMGVVPKLVKIFFSMTTGSVAGQGYFIGNGSGTSTSVYGCTLNVIAGGSGITLGPSQNAINFVTTPTGFNDVWSATITTLDVTNIVLTWASSGSPATMSFQLEAFA